MEARLGKESNLGRSRVLGAKAKGKDLTGSASLKVEPEGAVGRSHTEGVPRSRRGREGGQGSRESQAGC